MKRKEGDFYATSAVEGGVFDVEGGIAYINLPTKQIWVPGKYLRRGDWVRVTVERLAPRRNEKRNG